MVENIADTRPKTVGLCVLKMNDEIFALSLVAISNASILTHTCLTTLRRRAQKRGRDATRAARRNAAAAAAARGGLESGLVEPRIQIGNGRVRLGQSRVRGFARGFNVGAVATLGLLERGLGGGQLLGATTLCARAGGRVRVSQMLVMAVGNKKGKSDGGG